MFFKLFSRVDPSNQNSHSKPNPVLCALRQVHETLLAFWVSSDKVLRAMGASSHLHPSHRDSLIAFFTPIVRYIRIISRVCGDDHLKEAGEAFLAALQNGANTREKLEDVLQAGQHFREMSLMNYSTKLFIEQSQSENLKPGNDYPSRNIISAHTSAYEKFIAPTCETRSLFAKKAARKGLTNTHVSSWKKLRALISSKFARQN